VAMARPAWPTQSRLDNRGLDSRMNQKGRAEAEVVPAAPHDRRGAGREKQHSDWRAQHQRVTAPTRGADAIPASHRPGTVCRAEPQEGRISADRSCSKDIALL
jgi:hypothetical protein